MRVEYLLVAMIAFSVIGGLTTASASLEEGLVVYFSFDQGKTNEIKDLSGTGNNGIVHGDPEWIKGPKVEFGQAIEFDGTSQYIEVPDSDTMDVGDGDITFMLWIRQDADQPATYPRAVSKMPLAATDGPGFDLLAADGAGGPMEIFYGLSGAGNRQPVTVGQPLADGEWHHLVAMKDDEEGKIYLDGEVIGNAPLNPIDIDNDYPFVVGANGEPAVHTMFKGAVDEVAFYTRALTEDEIEEAMVTRPSTSVDLGSRFTITWGWIKAQD